jgi:YVTN family beta-propeller protein
MKRMMQKRYLCFVALIVFATPLAAQKGQVFVANKAGTTVSVIDTTTNKVVQTIEGIEVPEAARFSPDGKWVYVSQSAENFLNVVERATGKITKRIPLSGHANDLAVTPNGKYVVVCIATTPGYIDIIDTASLTKVKSIQMKARMHDVVVTGDSKWAVGGSPAGKFAAFVNMETLAVDGMMEMDMGVMPLAMENNADGSGNRLYLQLNQLNGFAVVDFKNRKEIRRVEHPKEPTGFGAGGAPSHGMEVAPDKKSIWVNSRPANAIFAYSIPDFKLLGRVDLPKLQVAGQPVRGSRPNWVTFSPDSKTVYVANRGMRSVTAIDAQTFKTIAVIPVGEAPDRVSTLRLP